MAAKQLSAKKRDMSINPRRVRQAGKIPATVYGNNFESVSIEVDSKEFQKAEISSTDIFDIKCDKEIYKVLLRKEQVDAVSDNVLNLEFLNIDDSRPITLAVPIEFMGTPPGVKLGGTLWTPIKSIKIHALPKDIPATLKIDLTALESLSAVLTVSQVDYPARVTPITDGRVILAKIIPPKVKDK